MQALIISLDFVCLLHYNLTAYNPMKLKYSIILVFVVLIFNNAKAQTYESVIDTTKFWSTLGVGCNGSHNSHYVKLSGDTIIGLETYKKMYQSFDSLLVNWDLLGFVREDTAKKVYGRNLLGDEGLLYDFDPNIGDTINFYNAISGRIFDMIVDTIYYDFFANKTRKIVEVYNANLSTSLIDTELWIEGVGSSSGLDEAGYRALGTCGVAWHLACYYENDTILYDNPIFAYCFYYTDDTYESIISDYKLWSVVQNDTNNNPSSYYLQFTYDTLINGLEYTKLEKSTHPLMIVWEDAGFVREDLEKRVYHWQNGVEYLIYDFELVKGDTLELGNPLFPTNTTSVIVDTIYIEYIGSKDRDVITLRNLSDNTTELWVEGIGSMAGLDKSGYQTLDIENINFELLCFNEFGTLEYQNANYSTCYFASNYITDNALSEILIYPNPVKTNLHFTINNDQLSIMNIEVIDISGNVVKQFRIQNSEFEIQVKNLEKGIYFLKIQTSKEVTINKFIKN